MNSEKKRIQQIQAKSIEITPDSYSRTCIYRELNETKFLKIPRPRPDRDLKFSNFRDRDRDFFETFRDFKYFINLLSCWNKKRLH